MKKPLQSNDELDENNPIHRILIDVYFSDHTKGKEKTILDAEAKLLKWRDTHTQVEVERAKQEFRDAFHIDKNKTYQVTASDKAIIIVESEHHKTLKKGE